MHPRSIDSGLRLRHKRGVKAVTLRYGFYRHLKRHDIVGRHQPFRVLEVYLMLPRRHLVVGGLYHKAHILQVEHDIPAHILSLIDRSHIEVAGYFVGLCRRPSFLVGLENEEFTLRPGVEDKAHIRRFLQHPS